jgi:hypothetical protein
MSMTLDQDIAALVDLRLSDPHRVLGAHPAPDGVIVRAFRPAAERVVEILRAVVCRHPNDSSGSSCPEYLRAGSGDWALSQTGHQKSKLARAQFHRGGWSRWNPKSYGETRNVSSLRGARTLQWHFRFPSRGSR